MGLVRSAYNTKIKINKMEFNFRDKKAIFPDKYFIEFRAKNQSHMIDSKDGTARNPKGKVIAIDEKDENYIITMSFPDGTDSQFSVPRNELRIENSGD